MDVIEEVVSNNNVSMPEGKRKNVGEEEIEVSRTHKRARRVAIESEKVAHDHTYCMKTNDALTALKAKVITKEEKEITKKLSAR
jgi:hypothetical protein